MPRDRWRATLESGPKLDLARLIPSGAGKPDSNIHCTLTYGSGERVTATFKLREYGGWLELSFGGRGCVKTQIEPHGLRPVVF
jgi:hypothetical protein